MMVTSDDKPGNCFSDGQYKTELKHTQCHHQLTWILGDDVHGL